MRISHHAPVRLPSGHWFDPERPRSEGVLSAEELDWCHHEGVPVGYDPAQTGWVSLLSEDDIDPDAPPTLPPQGPSGLHLRRWRSGEAAVMRALLDDPEVWRHLPETYPAPLSLEVAADLIQVASIEHHHEVRAVEHEGVVVGQFRLLFDRHGADRRAAEISYWLGRSHWGRGLGTQLVRQATDDAFARHAELARIHARVHPDNPASAAILAKAGYRPRVRTDGWLGFERLRAA